MWDAAVTADPKGVFQHAALTETEKSLLRRVSDTSLADSLQRATLSLYSVRGVTPGRSVYVVGPITETKLAFTDGAEFTQKAKELTRDGAVVEGTWRRREFNNGLRNGEELTSLAPIPELEFIRQVIRFQDARNASAAATRPIPNCARSSSRNSTGSPRAAPTSGACSSRRARSATPNSCAASPRTRSSPTTTSSATSGPT
jgi:hypothetical protein